MPVSSQKVTLQKIDDMKPSVFPPYTLNFGGRLCPLARPQVMGILNITPDSFFDGSRTPRHAPDDIRQRTRRMLNEGADILDVGAYSTRPGAAEVTVEEEIRRLADALSIIREEAPDAVLSVDTFRADVARMCVEDFGVQIINDISGGTMDKAMLRTVARLGVPYILMHTQGEPSTMQIAPHYDDVVAEVIEHLARRVQRLRDYGGKDIIIDPGFGFGKTLEHNYRLMEHLDDFHELSCPLLVGISRKSMIYRLLGSTPLEALNGTTVLNTIALTKGAHFLRVHDVAPAVEACKLVAAMRATVGQS